VFTIRSLNRNGSTTVLHRLDVKWRAESLARDLMTIERETDSTGDYAIMLSDDDKILALYLTRADLPVFHYVAPPRKDACKVCGRKPSSRVHDKGEVRLFDHEYEPVIRASREVSA
jgi:hypothetical protein